MHGPAIGEAPHQWPAALAAASKYSRIDYARLVDDGPATGRQHPAAKQPDDAMRSLLNRQGLGADDDLTKLLNRGSKYGNDPTQPLEAEDDPLGPDSLEAKMQELRRLWKEFQGNVNAILEPEAEQASFEAGGASRLLDADDKMTPPPPIDRSVSCSPRFCMRSSCCGWSLARRLASMSNS